MHGGLRRLEEVRFTTTGFVCLFWGRCVLSNSVLDTAESWIVAFQTRGGVSGVQERRGLTSATGR